MAYECPVAQRDGEQELGISELWSMCPCKDRKLNSSGSDGNQSWSHASNKQLCLTFLYVWSSVVFLVFFLLSLTSTVYRFCGFFFSLIIFFCFSVTSIVLLFRTTDMLHFVLLTSALLTALKSICRQRSGCWGMFRSQHGNNNRLWKMYCEWKKCEHFRVCAFVCVCSLATASCFMNLLLCLIILSFFLN